MMSTSTITARGVRRLQSAVWGLGFLVGLSAAGCGKPLDPKEYGKVIHEIPKVEGAATPYLLPQLDAPEPGEVEK
jgi:hypothetical protein